MGQTPSLLCGGLRAGRPLPLVPPLPAGAALQYELSLAGEGPERRAAPYDAVVVAAPLRAGAGISFPDWASPGVPGEGEWQGAVVTLVHGYLNTSLFGFRDARLFPYAGVLTTAAAAALPPLFFNSVAGVYPVEVPPGFRRKRAHEAAVYKVFSPAVLTGEQLKTLFR